MPRGMRHKQGQLTRAQNNTSKKTLNHVLIEVGVRANEEFKRKQVIAGIKKYRAELEAELEAELAFQDFTRTLLIKELNEYILQARRWQEEDGCGDVKIHNIILYDLEDYLQHRNDGSDCEAEEEVESEEEEE